MIKLRLEYIATVSQLGNKTYQLQLTQYKLFIISNSHFYLMEVIRSVNMTVITSRQKIFDMICFGKVREEKELILKNSHFAKTIK